MGKANANIKVLIWSEKENLGHLAASVFCATLDLRVVGLSPALDKVKKKFEI